MVVSSREAHLGATFVHLADSLVSGFDVVDLLDTLVHECKSVLAVDEAGLVLTNGSGVLSTMASTSSRASALEIAQLQAGEGPCIEAFHRGRVVTIDDIERSFTWAPFRDMAISMGFRSVHAVPLRLRTETIGAINLFGEEPGALDEEDAAVAQALADVATIAIIQHRTARENTAVRWQLQSALDSRVLIEQAKGVLAQSLGISVDQAFCKLRGYARSHSEPLQQVAEAVVGQRLQL